MKCRTCAVFFGVSEPSLLHLQEELVSMKQRIRVVVVDNEKLQGDLKSKMVEETLKDYTLLDATVQYTAVSEQALSVASHPPRG